MTLVVTVLAVGLIAWRTPLYTSVAKVEVRPLTIDEQFQQQLGLDSFANMETEATRVTQEPVAKLAAPALGLNPRSSSDLAYAAAAVDVTVQPNTTFLQISCVQDGAARAQRCASAFASAFVLDRIENARILYEERVESEQEKIRQANERVERLSEQLDQLTGDQDAARSILRAQIEAQTQLIAAASTNVLTLPTASPNAAVLARSAELPVGPSNKGFLFTGILAAMLGLALGIGLALVRERYAEPIASALALEQVLEAPALAAVPTLPAGPHGRRPTLVTTHAPESPASQAYRGAGAGLLHLANERTMKFIVVTGAGEREGKTAVTGNLAVVLAQSGSRVVAVSCDLRNPTLHRFFGQDNEVGVTDLLTGRAVLNNALQETDEPDLVVLASGPLPRNPTELWGSDGVERLFAELRSRFDFVLLDAGPGLVADVLFLVRHADGIIVVADAAKTSRSSVAQLRQRLKSVGGHIIGGILHNRAPMRADRASRFFPIVSKTPHSRGSADKWTEAAGSDPRGGGGDRLAPAPRATSGSEREPEPEPEPEREPEPQPRAQPKVKPRRRPSMVSFGPNAKGRR